jgi:isopenicillin N synthase-like dioxygenase
LRIVAHGIGVDNAYFDDILRDGTHLTRAIHYPAMTNAPTSTHVWADAHTDINLVTGLPRATGPGLQLLGEQGWLDVLPPEGHMVLNSGIMLERLTNGRIPAGTHRVMASTDQLIDRYSVVQFCHPAPWFQLAPVPSCSMTTIRCGTARSRRALSSTVSCTRSASSATFTHHSCRRQGCGTLCGQRL